jgi:hypothetical protein
MNTSARPDALREADHVKEHGGNPSADALRQELRPREQTPPRDPRGPCAPEEGAGETFVGGAGI